MHDHTPPAAAEARAANVCPRCGAPFSCGMQTGAEPCWCAALPPLSSIPDGQVGCFCPDCLKAFVAAEGGTR